MGDERGIDYGAARAMVLRCSAGKAIGGSRRRAHMLCRGQGCRGGWRSLWRAWYAERRYFRGGGGRFREVPWALAGLVPRVAQVPRLLQ